MDQERKELENSYGLRQERIVMDQERKGLENSYGLRKERIVMDQERIRKGKVGRILECKNLNIEVTVNVTVNVYIYRFQGSSLELWRDGG